MMLACRMVSHGPSTEEAAEMDHAIGALHCRRDFVGLHEGRPRRTSRPAAGPSAAPDRSAPGRDVELGGGRTRHRSDAAGRAGEQDAPSLASTIFALLLEAPIALEPAREVLAHGPPRLDGIAVAEIAVTMRACSCWLAPE